MRKIAFALAYSAFALSALATQGDETSNRAEDAVQVGMTRVDVRTVLREVNRRYPDRSCIICAGGPNWSWDKIGPTTYLVLEYVSPGEPKKGGIADDALVNSVKIVHFDDLAEPYSDTHVRIRGQEDPVLKEAWECIRLVHQAAAMDPQVFDPAALIRAVNGLRSHGKQKIVRALRIYRDLSVISYRLAKARLGQLRAFMAQQTKYDLDQERIFLLCTLLFAPKEPGVRMPRIPIASWGEDESSRRVWPDFPLVVVDQIPFLLTTQWILCGIRPDPARLIDFCESSCIIRGNALTPKAFPVDAAERLCNSDVWNHVFGGDKDMNPGVILDEVDHRHLVRVQALKCLDLYQLGDPDLWSLPDRILPARRGAEHADKLWLDYAARLRRMPFAWDAGEQRFRLGDKEAIGQPLPMQRPAQAGEVLIDGAIGASESVQGRTPASDGGDEGKD